MKKMASVKARRDDWLNRAKKERNKASSEPIIKKKAK
jgi:hypothetical protein